MSFSGRDRHPRSPARRVGAAEPAQRAGRQADVEGATAWPIADLAHRDKLIFAMRLFDENETRVVMAGRFPNPFVRNTSQATRRGNS